MNQYSATQKGSVGETFFIAEATSKGYSVNIPVSPQSYDCLICTDSKIFRIQIKSNFDRSSIRYINKYHNKIDVLAIYIKQLKKFYLIPMKYIAKNKNITVSATGSSKSKFKPYLDNWNIFNEQEKEKEIPQESPIDFVI